MDRRFLTVLALSLVFALLVSSVFYRVARSGRPNGQSRVEQKEIVLAAHALSVGTTVKPADLKIGLIPVSMFPRGAYSHVNEVVERSVLSNILADEAVMGGRLAAKGSGMGLAPAIPDGMRAVTVRVNDVVGVAGFVFPGMRVDVLVTGRPPESAGMITTTCLQNIRVLSAGTTTQPDARGQAIPAPTVTLLVSPDQAETLTLAASDGRIQLVLRNSNDERIEKTPGRELSELYGMHLTKPKPAEEPALHERPRRAANPPAVHGAKTPPNDEVIVFRGTKRSVEVISSAAGAGESHQ